MTFSAAVLLVYTGLFTWFNWFYQEPPINYPGTIKVTPESQNVKHGQSIIFRVTRCAKDNYDIVASRRIVDGLVWDIPDTHTKVTKGCETYDRASFQIPDAVPFGKYHLEGEVTVKINWFIFAKTRVASFKTDSFNIVK